ncbi:MAG: hypothetical protein V2I46_03810 [Bacteroides sp.]|nr:hypothetical protein [Bacteroides sp.]
MKKIVFAFAVLVLTGLTGLASNAFDAFSNESFQEQSQAYQDRECFTEIDVSLLPDAVTKAAKNGQPDVTLVSAEVKVLPNGEKIYKVMMRSEEKGLFTWTFHADGKEYMKEEKKEEKKE